MWVVRGVAGRLSRGNRGIWGMMTGIGRFTVARSIGRVTGRRVLGGGRRLPGGVRGLRVNVRMVRGTGDPMSVLEGVERDLARVPVGLRESGLAAVARAMAEAIDGGQGSRSECCKVLIDALVRLRELAPEEVPEDGVDELANARRKRRQGGSAA